MKNLINIKTSSEKFYNQKESLSNPSQAIRIHKILEIADNNMNM
ncbi:hypothetical protein [Aliarcobacter cryaerophilus]|nr:hypothetical protein [Aliarcobacter cryaerophilus]